MVGTSSHPDESAAARLLPTLEQLLAIEATDLQVALVEASDLVVQALGADKVDAALHDAATDTLVAAGSSRTEMARQQHATGLNRLPVANGGREVDVFLSGDSYLTGRADEDPGQLLAIVELLGVRSAAIVPLDVAGNRRGVVIVSSAQHDFFTEEDLQFLQAVARWVGALAHRAELVQQLTAEAAERGRRLAADELVTVLAHDLGNYLAPIKARIDLLRRRARREDRQRDLQDAEGASQALDWLRRLIADLLDVGRLEQGIFAVSPQPVDLSGLARETAAAFQAGSNAIKIGGESAVPALVDPDRLRQALENLLSNAVRHSPEGAPVHLDVGLEENGDGRWAVLTVSDQGPGVPPDLLPRLFNRYVRGSGSSGLGLGLYLASRIAAAHGGSLTVDSPPGQGACFRLAVPSGDELSGFSGEAP